MLHIFKSKWALGISCDDLTNLLFIERKTNGHRSKVGKNKVNIEKN